MTKSPPTPLAAYRLPKSLLRDGWWLVEPREAVIIPFRRRDRGNAPRPPRRNASPLNKENES